MTVTNDIDSINMKQLEWKLSTWKTCVRVQIKEDQKVGIKYNNGIGS